MTLKQSFYRQLGSAGDIDSIIRAYSAVNAEAMARALMPGGIPDNEYLELYEDFVQRSITVPGANEAVTKEWGGELPFVLKNGENLNHQKNNTGKLSEENEYLAAYRKLSPSRRREIDMVSDYCRKKEGYRKDFDFSFGDRSERNLMVTQDMEEYQKANVYTVLKAMLVKLVEKGGAGAFHWYTGTEDSFVKTSSYFLAKGSNLFRVSGSHALAALKGTREIPGNEFFETPALKLKLLQ